MIVLSSFRARLDAAERDLAVEALKVAHGSITQAARLTGLPRSQLRRVVLRHNLTALLVNHQSAARGGNAAWLALGDV